MKKILYIARNELASLFYSPIAWFFLIFFMVMTSLDYLESMGNFVGHFQRGGSSMLWIENLTFDVTVNGWTGYFFKILTNLYMLFPLITMGLISREIGSGSIKLLYSSPVHIREIVLGKYLAILTFTACLMLLVGCTVVGFCMSTKQPDYLQLLFSFIGVFLQLATYAAIGLFVSSLTSYALVAALVTLAIFALLTNIGSLWQEIAIVNDITFYLNIREKSVSLIYGLFNLRDVMYFLIIIASFIAFTIIRLRTATESIPKLQRMMKYVVIVMVALATGYITNNPYVNMYFDATRNDINTISVPTRKMLSKLDDGKLEITTYVNLLNNGIGRFVISERNRIIRDKWDPYSRFKPDINVKYVYYYDCDSSYHKFKTDPGKSLEEIAKEQADNFGIDLGDYLGPEEIRKQVDVKAEGYRCFFTLKYKDRITTLRTFDDNLYWPLEDEIAAALNRLVETPPKIGFLTGQIERDPFSRRLRDYSSLASTLGNRIALINQGYDCDTVNPDKPISPDYAALVLADPRTPFTPEAIDRINRYIDEGGNMMILSEPDRREIVRPILDKLGITLRDGMLVQPSERYSSDLVFNHMTAVSKNCSPQIAKKFNNWTKWFGDTAFMVALPGASTLEIKNSGFVIEPLLVTDGNLNWNRISPIDKDSLQLKLSKKEGDESGPFVTAIRMHRMINGKEQRIIMVGDADHMSNTGTEVQVFEGRPDRYNYEFGFWNMSYFSYGKFPANTLKREPLDNEFYITLDGVDKQNIIFIWIVPGLMAIGCIVMLIKRKRK
ncbi:MAG: Gldg family protein [Chitinophagaceae bacterium]|nr:Gldg family protein [Chitinophagaceae bacterium]